MTNGFLNQIRMNLKIRLEQFVALSTSLVIVTLLMLFNITHSKWFNLSCINPHNSLMMEFVGTILSHWAPVKGKAKVSEVATDLLSLTLARCWVSKSRHPGPDFLMCQASLPPASHRFLLGLWALNPSKSHSPNTSNLTRAFQEDYQSAQKHLFLLRIQPSPEIRQGKCPERL